MARKPNQHRIQLTHDAKLALGFAFAVLAVIALGSLLGIDMGDKNLNSNDYARGSK